MRYARLATLTFQSVTNPSALPCLIPPQAINPHSSPHTQTLECKINSLPRPDPPPEMQSRYSYIASRNGCPGLCIDERSEKRQKYCTSLIFDSRHSRRSHVMQEIEKIRKGYAARAHDDAG